MIQTIENEDKITKTAYDVLGREVSTTINDRVVSSKEYDAVGNIVSEMEDGITVKHVYDELNRVKEDQMEDMEIKDTFKMIYTYEYDESGNQTKVSDVYGNVKTKTYNAHNAVISETDANGNTSKFEYDSLNNMTKVQNALERVATYQYDGNNNLVERKIGDKKAKYEYDANDHMTYEENEYGQKLHYTYDVNGNLLSETKNDGSVIEYAYDNLGNMLKEGSRSFTYNNHNNKVSASYKNKTITYQYDKFNNIAEVKDANNNTTKYKWDVYGNRNEVSTSKTTVKYSYDDRNLMTSVKEGTKEVASYTYDNRGNVTSLTRDKLKSEYQYDELNRRIVFNNYKNNELKSTYTYAFDGNDNVIKEVIIGKENTYTYDAMDELKTSSKYVDGKVVNTEYSYDFLGNKVEKTEDGDVRKYHYNKYNQLTNITTKEGITDIYYDKNGNMENILYAGGQKEHYDYDEFGQLTKVTSTKDQSYEFSYDAEGDRIQYVKNVRDEYDDKTWYNYLEGLEFEEVKDLLEDKNSEDTFDSLVYQSQYHIETGSCVYPPEYSDADWYRKDIKYAVDKSLEFSEVLFTSTGDVNIYGNGERLYTKNGMNKTTYINGLNKSVYETVDMKFDFYGCRETSKEYSYTDTGYSKKHKFGYGYNGEALDDTGLIYLRARYYNPRIGQFIQLDTYKGEQNSIESQNRYAYTMNNPYKYVDISGNKSIKLKMNPSKLIGKVINKNTNKTKPIVSTLTGKTISGTVVNYLKEKQEEREKERIRQQFINAGIPADHPDLKFGVDLAYSIKKLCTLLLQPKISDEKRQGEALLESYEWYKSNYKTIIDGVNGIGKGIGKLSDYINKRNNDSNANDDLCGSKPLLYGATERVGTLYSASIKQTQSKKILEKTYYTETDNFMNEGYTNEIRNNLSFTLDNIGETLESINAQAVITLLTHFLDLVTPTGEDIKYEFNFIIKQESKRVDIYRFGLYLPVFTAYKSIVFGKAKQRSGNKKIEDRVFTEQSPYSVNYSNKNYNNNYKLGQQGADIIKKNNEFYNYSSALSQIQGDKNVNWKSIEYFSVATTF